MSNNRNWLNKLRYVYTSRGVCRHRPEDIGLYLLTQEDIYKTHLQMEGGEITKH